ncbi:hypothetical protein Baya_13257 [Bagarius yarrelli]|uniref:Uncharacterized protein n=1 Tax=Bagarius yarrelli TaxID=175774 RepID=A0A556V576_BAGYA|nr:hypothetical protein Baya_13257 [Bagarius yarrelli]
MATQNHDDVNVCVLHLVTWNGLASHFRVSLPLNQGSADRLWIKQGLNPDLHGVEAAYQQTEPPGTSDNLGVLSFREKERSASKLHYRRTSRRRHQRMTEFIISPIRRNPVLQIRHVRRMIRFLLSKSHQPEISENLLGQVLEDSKTFAAHLRQHFPGRDRSPAGEPGSWQEAQIIRFSQGIAISLTFNPTQTSGKLRLKPPAKSAAEVSSLQSKKPAPVGRGLVPATQTYFSSRVLRAIVVSTSVRLCKQVIRFRSTGNANVEPYTLPRRPTFSPLVWPKNRRNFSRVNIRVCVYGGNPLAPRVLPGGSSRDEEWMHVYSRSKGDHSSGTRDTPCEDKGDIYLPENDIQKTGPSPLRVRSSS